MRILAIEYSTRIGSAAVLDEDQVLEAAQWDDDAPATPGMFASVRALMGRAAFQLADITNVVVGLGPGTYTNLRTSVTLAHSLALPGGIPVRGICSAEAIAEDLHAAYGATRVSIVGNARRRKLWIMQYARTHSLWQVQREITLVDEQELAPCLAENETIASPDGRQIIGRLATVVSSSIRLIESACIPRAETLARLARQAPLTGRDTAPGPMPLRPIYLHPPVFVPPRFSTCPAGCASVSDQRARQS